MMASQAYLRAMEFCEQRDSADAARHKSRTAFLFRPFIRQTRWSEGHGTGAVGHSQYGNGFVSNAKKPS
jgi:hypothetical protein